ncbi:hypothetical protein DYB25_003031 [Aphanomyces astaci]|uniref:Peptidase C51 domain-containing protein n=2 Tax=Aphanomyces astaci TaxID=112090 RepID=A0A397BMD7_APHAT|nr:hypothetical protein DYB25_003031 [Aphanomyces astaci]RHY43871.1 hypothetical protein DYB38_003602 [Aphanomyces astaci]RHY61052.1 hypothetical protein DYB30_002337 [Aphanomyces astaci]RHY85646.1 hypothetical protein DYB26_001319 [Aphanomyces astaci]RHZ38820.1 hypothetical protein DYB31_001126 [Aphanomyces astaci]
MATSQRRWPGDNPDGAKTIPVGMVHGAVLGSYKGVEGYNNNYKNNPHAEHDDYDGSNFLNGVCTGMKWQCVEYARRYWIVNHGIVLPSLSWAAHIWDRVTHASRLGDFAIVPLLKFPNFGTEKPVVGDLLVYKSTPSQWVGHVAVVADVVTKEGGTLALYVAEQNMHNDKLWAGGHYADELHLVTGTSRDGKTTYSITHPDPDLILDGWVRASLDDAVLRAPWSRPPPRLPLSGVYDKESATALQKFVGSYADGSHGGMTNTDLRNILRQHGDPSEAPTTPNTAELVKCLRLFLARHWALVRSTGDDDSGKDLVAVCPGTTQCVCRVIRREEIHPASSEDGAAVEVCHTTKALQGFLNSVHHPHDLRSAAALVDRA